MKSPAEKLERKGGKILISSDFHLSTASLNLDQEREGEIRGIFKEAGRKDKMYKMSAISCH